MRTLHVVCGGPRDAPSGSPGRPRRTTKTAPQRAISWAADARGPRLPANARLRHSGHSELQLTRGMRGHFLIERTFAKLRGCGRGKRAIPTVTTDFSWPLQNLVGQRARGEGVRMQPAR